MEWDVEGNVEGNVEWDVEVCMGEGTVREYERLYTSGREGICMHV